MRITAWKFGKDNLTVKYEIKDGAYTLKTADEPVESLYRAAAEVAIETRAALRFLFDASFSAITISYGSDKPNAAIVLTMGTLIRESAEVKCPKIDRRQHLDTNAGMETLPGMDANTIPFVYNKFVELNLAIDVFLKEAEAFVLSRKQRQLALFDKLDISEHEGGDD